MMEFQNIHQSMWNDKGCFPWILDLILQWAIAYSYSEKNQIQKISKSNQHSI